MALADARGYYTSHAPMTAPGPHGRSVRFESVGATAEAIQGWMMHPFHAALYGVPLPADAEDHLANRSARAILDRILSIDARPLGEARVPEKRTIGNCRHFTTLCTALLREQGIPARSRCGFGAYFMPDRFVDHWVCEYWNESERRWVLVDAQIDDVQRKAMGLEALDTLDLGREQFQVAGQVWQRCRAGEIDPERCGILDMWGLWFVLGNLVRDVAALCKTELLPWDNWGVMLTPLEDISEKEMALLDRAAALTADPDHDTAELRALYAESDALRVPPEIFSFRPVEGRVDVSAVLPAD